jgi:ABC-2 type transport system permease protein
MRYYLTLYVSYVRLFWKTLLQYRADLAVFFVTMLIADALSLAFVTLVFGTVRQLQGWGFYEVVLMYGLIRASSALSVLLLNAPWSVPAYIRSGMLDTLLVRPPSPLFQLVGAEGIEPSNIGSLFVAFVAIWTGLAQTLAPLQAWWLIYIPLVICSGAVLQFSLLLMVASLAVRFVSVQSAMYPVGWFADFARFPTTIYSRTLQVLLTWVLPYATASFYPAAFLLRGEPYRLAGILSPLAGPIFLGLALLVWGYALSRYQSTGS